MIKRTTLFLLGYVFIYLFIFIMKKYYYIFALCVLFCRSFVDGRISSYRFGVCFFFFFFISIFVVDGLTLDLPTGYDLFLLSPLKNSTAIITTEAFKKTSPLSPSDGWRERDSRCINALTLQLFPSSILYYFLFFP